MFKFQRIFNLFHVSLTYGMFDVTAKWIGWSDYGGGEAVEAA